MTVIDKVNCPDCGGEIEIRSDMLFFSDGSTATGCDGCGRTVSVRRERGRYVPAQIRSRLNDRLAREHAALRARVAADTSDAA